jgi:hypothetical protein
MRKSGALILFAAIFFGFGVSEVALGQDKDRYRRELVETDALDQPLPENVKLKIFIHHPKAKGPSLGTCTPTASDSTDFGLAGWHLPSGGITWMLNGSSVPGNIGAGAAQAALEASFATWNGADSAEQFSFGGTTGVKKRKLDGVNAVMWGKLGKKTIAATYVWFSTDTDEVVEIDMVFNQKFPWAIFSDGGGECQSSPAAYDVQDIATHEIGHWVGLDDLFDAADVDLTMYGFGAGGELKKRTLASGDVAGAAAVAP